MKWRLGWPRTLASQLSLIFLISLVCALIFAAKIVFFFFLFAMAKAIVPRYRYDQLMRLGWKVFLPTSLVAVALAGAWRVFGPGV